MYFPVSNEKVKSSGKGIAEIITWLLFVYILTVICCLANGKTITVPHVQLVRDRRKLLSDN
jgi:hypothetical protein